MSYSENITKEDLINVLEYVGLGKTAILNCYPVGSYYETSDLNFNPNAIWGGTWSKITKNSVERKATTGVSMPKDSTTDIVTATIPANSEYLLLGRAGTGVGTGNQNTNVGFRIVSGTGSLTDYGLSVVGSASAGAHIPGTAYIKTTTKCVVAVTKYNYSGSDLTTGTGRIACIPLTNFNDGKITWYRTA